MNEHQKAQLEDIFAPQILGDTCPECYTNFPESISKAEALFESAIREAQFHILDLIEYRSATVPVREALDGLRDALQLAKENKQ